MPRRLAGLPSDSPQNRDLDKIHDPLEGLIPLSPSIIREETFYLDIDKDVLSDWTGKKMYLGVNSANKGRESRTEEV